MLYVQGHCGSVKPTSWQFNAGICGLHIHIHASPLNVSSYCNC